jgi:hypothetical protein
MLPLFIHLLLFPKAIEFSVWDCDHFQECISCSRRINMAICRTCSSQRGILFYISIIVAIYTHYIQLFRVLSFYIEVKYLHKSFKRLYNSKVYACLHFSMYFHFRKTTDFSVRDWENFRANIRSILVFSFFSILFRSI